MELLLPAIITLLTQGFKWLVEKLGYVKAKTYTLLVAFVFSLIGTFVWKNLEGQVVWNDVQSLVSIFGLAIGYYEIFVKRFLTPILNKFKK